MFALDAGREVVHRAGVGHVDPEWVNKRCLIGGGFHRREIDVGRYHLGAGARERERGSATDPAAGTSDHREPPLEVASRAGEARAPQRSGLGAALGVGDELSHCMRD